MFAAKFDSYGNCYGPNETNWIAPPGKISRQLNADLTEPEWKAITARLDAIRFWRPEEDTSKPCDGELCIDMDPSWCLIEGARGNEHRVRLVQLDHLVEDDKAFFEACEAILQPTKFDLGILRQH